MFVTSKNARVNGSSLLRAHVVEHLHKVVALRLVGLLQLRVARRLEVDLLQVVAELPRDVGLARENEHAAHGPEDLLLALGAHLVDGLQGDLGLDLLALSQLQGAVHHAELFNGREEVALVLTEL